MRDLIYSSSDQDTLGKRKHTSTKHTHTYTHAQAHCPDIIADSIAGSGLSDIFNILEILFTLLFLFELLWNMFSNWLRPFLKDNWSLFDSFVVAISLLSLSTSGLGVGVQGLSKSPSPSLL